jgi:hypothetical protein
MTPPATLRPIPFQDIIRQPPRVELSAQDIAQLAALSTPGGPLAKIVHIGLDFERELRDTIAEHPLVDEAARAHVRDLQVQRATARAWLNWLVSQISTAPLPVDERNTDNGI